MTYMCLNIALVGSNLPNFPTSELFLVHHSHNLSSLCSYTGIVKRLQMTLLNSRIVYQYKTKVLLNVSHLLFTYS